MSWSKMAMPKQVWRTALPLVGFALTLGLVVALAPACGSCRSTAPPSDAQAPRVDRAFYYWRTTLRLSASEERALARLHIGRLYLRVFDIEWRDGGPATVAAIEPADGTRLPPSLDVVPVVFLRDDVFRHLAPAQAAELARTVFTDARARARLVGAEPHELQLDCDWTDATRDRFFAFVRDVRALATAEHVALGATIRLHQVKYRERTGVPPVDRGMLMFYNMGELAAEPGARAIFDPARAAQYLDRLAEYPLPLDVALPIWSWTIQLRDEQVEALLQSTDPDELPALPFLQRIGPNRYVATRNAFLHGALLREGDVLKGEVTGPADTQAAARLLAPRLPGRTGRTVSLFDLSERNLAHHDLDRLDQVFQTIR